VTVRINNTPITMVTASYSYRVSMFMIKLVRAWHHTPISEVTSRRQCPFGYKIPWFWCVTSEIGLTSVVTVFRRRRA